MLRKLTAPGGPLGVFGEYPILLRLACICVFAEIAWATLLIVMQYHFMDDLLRGQARQLIASRIATATLAFVACETLFKIPMGALADRYGPRPLIFFALTVSALSPMLMIVAAREWYHFVPLRGLDGLGAAALWPAMSALMALSVPREAKASAMGVFNGAYCLGLAVGPMVGLYLGHRYGNRSVFPLCALLMLTGLFIAWRVLRNGVGDKLLSAKPHMIGEGFPARGNSVLRGRPMLWRMMALYAVSQCAVGFLANTMVPYVDGQFGIKEGDLPRLMMGPALAVAILALPLGRMADSIGRPQAVWISYVMAAVGMLMVASTSLMPATTDLTSLPLALFGGGMLLLVGSYILGTPAWLGLTSVQVDDSKQAQALSLMQTAQGVGVVFGTAMVASAGHLLTRWDKVKLVVTEKMPKVAQVLHWKTDTIDIVPIDRWLWAAVAIFVLCLIGTLLWVREPEHAQGSEEQAKGAKQPLEITGV
ncbi:MAG: transporter, family, multidrug resistance protein [Abditibacteriota bacterium]|nr:transporter, family, multidrug resistance protein [Abditibacteriota bacterium]